MNNVNATIADIIDSAELAKRWGVPETRIRDRVRRRALDPIPLYLTGQVASPLSFADLEEHSSAVLPECYTARCICDFASAARTRVPNNVLETAIYTEDDGIVDWRFCKTDEQSADFAVRGTHIGLVFNPSVYRIIADRLAVGSV